MKKKLYERTVRMRELQVSVYNLKQEKRDMQNSIDAYKKTIEDHEKEIRRLQDIVYNVTSINLKPGFGFDGGNKLSVPKYKGYDNYMLNIEKEKQ